MTRLAILLSLLVVAAVPAQAATWPAATCDRADVVTAIGLASDGDTVTVPVCSLTTWTSTLTITKAIILQGAGVGATIIGDGVTSGALITWPLVAGRTDHRLTGIEFQNNGRVSTNTNGIIQITGTLGTGRFRIDNVKVDHLNGRVFQITKAWGLIDHVTCLSSGTRICIYNSSGAAGGVPYYGLQDTEWARTTNIVGREDCLYIEDSTFTFDSGSHYAAHDGFGGTCTVVRFNTFTRGFVEVHGTESAGPSRGHFVLEGYRNTFTANDGGSGEMFDIRSGTYILFDNTATGYTASPSTGGLNISRTVGLNLPWLQADGTSPWDRNDPGNPFATYTSTAASGLTVTVGSASWTTDQWTGYIIRKTSNCTFAVLVMCSAPVISNTATVITFAANGFGEDNLDFGVGDNFELNKITEILDQPGVVGGTQLSEVNCKSITSSGTTATATCAGHGFSTGDKVAMRAAISTRYRLTRTITVTGTDTFTYEFEGNGDVAATFVGTATKVPSGWYDQVDMPGYEWGNTEDGADVDVAVAPYYALTIRPNEHYVNDVPSGTSLPGTCTVGDGYWKTDEGEWWAANAGTDGRLYKCTSTNTWTLYYTPYTYPHTLQGEVVQGRSPRSLLRRP